VSLAVEMGLRPSDVMAWSVEDYDLVMTHYRMLEAEREAAAAEQRMRSEVSDG